jgi:hypothetical protein
MLPSPILQNMHDPLRTGPAIQNLVSELFLRAICECYSSPKLRFAFWSKVWLNLLANSNNASRTRPGVIPLPYSSRGYPAPALVPGLSRYRTRPGVIPLPHSARRHPALVPHSTRIFMGPGV